MEIINNTSQYFEENPDYIIDYLISRGLSNDAYNDFIKSFKFGLLKKMRFQVNGKEYEISHILGKSEVSGYDIIMANDNLELSEGEDIAIALIAGDDPICYNIVKKNVCIVYPDADGRERVEINQSLEDFVKRFDSNSNIKTMSNNLERESDWRCYNIKAE